MSEQIYYGPAQLERMGTVLSTKRFHAVIPEGYAPNRMRVQQLAGIQLPYQPNPMDMARSVVTCVDVVDLCFQEMPFSFIDPSDQNTVLILLRTYIDAVKQLIPTAMKTEPFIIRAQRAIETLEAHRHRQFRVSTGRLSIPNMPYSETALTLLERLMSYRSTL